MSYRPKRAKKSGGALWRRLLLGLLGLVLGVNAYLANARIIAGNQLPMPFGIGAATVLSGSMEPTLSRGDLILVRQTDQVRVGDIIVYQSGRSLVVHRVIDLDGDTVTTQGDANNAPDEPFDRSAVKGTVWVVLPHVGAALNLLKTPAGTILALALAFFLVERSFRREQDAAQQDQESIKEEIRRLRRELDKDQ